LEARHECATSDGVTFDADDLPTDPEALRALLIAERTRHAQEIARIAGERDRLRAIIHELQRHRFGRRSEQLDSDQLALALEDVEQTVAAVEAAAERAATPGQTRARRKINRGALPALSWSWLVGQVGSGFKVYSGC
jgi:transposase